MDIETHTWPGRAILHVDMDAFFASVEQLDHPDWRGKPVIVGGTAAGRGVVAAASYEARAFGVRSAMPSAQASRLCPDAIWAPGRFDRYRELSARVCALFRDASPLVEQVSIDEAYLDVSPSLHRPADPVAIAGGIQRAVDTLGLSCSIGIATSKTVAKIASDHDKPHGITVVRPGEERAFLKGLAVRALPGIGGAAADRLRAAGIRTLGDLATLDDATARHILGSGGPGLVRRAAGIDDRPVGGTGDVKSVSSEHTFAADIRTAEEVDAVMRGLVRKVAARLRAKELQGRTATVKVRFADFTTKTASRTLEVPTDLDDDLIEVALRLTHETWSPGTGVRLLGFGASGFATPSCQLDLLSEGQASDRPRRKALADSLDEIRHRFGTDAIGFGGDRPPRKDE